MPFGAVQIISTLGGAWLATKLKMKSPVLALLCLPPITGILILMNVEYKPSNRAVLLVGYYLISVYPGISPLIYSWSGQNTGGDTKRKVTTACLFVGASAGNIGGPLLFKPEEAPHYSRGLRTNLALFITILVLILAAVGWITVLNRKHAARRQAMGKSAKVVDLSMVDKSQASEAEEAADVQNEGVGERGFDDETDLKNEEFIYLY